MKHAYQKVETVKDYEKKRFARPYRAMSHDKEVATINRMLKKEKPKKILDLALGPARVSKNLNTNYFEQGFGLDSSLAMLSVAKELLDQSKWKLVEGDAFKTPFPNNELDIVTTFRFIRHFRKNDRVRLYQEIKRILRPGGLLIFEAFNYRMGDDAKNITGIGKPSAFREPVYDELWTREELIQELNTAGFKVEKLVPVLNCFRLEHFLSGVSNRLAEILHFKLLNYPTKWLIRLIDIIPTKTTHQWEVIARKN